MGKMINTVAESVTLDFFMDREGAILGVVMKLHLGGVKTGFAFDEVTDCGVLDNHFRPERVAGETEEKVAFVGCDFDDDIGPAG